MTSPSRDYQFIFRPTERCNLRCRYCYAASLANGGTMSSAEARTAVDWMVRFCDKHEIADVSILWHGGEPLLPGADFMADVLGYMEERFSGGVQSVSHQIQTNLLLVNDRFVDLFRRYFAGSIGFSYDYASSLRVHADGRNAADEIWEKALWCQSRGVRVGAICQITPENRGDPLGLYRKFSDAGISFRLTPVFPCGKQDVVLSVETLCRVADAWLDDPDPRVEIANLREMVEALMRGHGSRCCHECNCGRVLMTISPGGRIYPCTRTCSEMDVIGDWKLDDVDVVHHRRMAFFGAKDSRKCLSCRFRSSCGGGCAYQYRAGWHDCECEFNYRVLSHLAERLVAEGYELH